MQQDAGSWGNPDAYAKSPAINSKVGQGIGGAVHGGIEASRYCNIALRIET